MKILFLADLNSEHTIKWGNALILKNIDIKIFGFSKLLNNNNLNRQIIVFSGDIKINDKEKIYTKLSKIRYLKYIFYLKKIIKEFKPDIIHSHYASSYGLLGALSGFHPLLVSVWGSDIFDFPRKNLFRKKILKFVFNKADIILSTSNVMAKETVKYTDKQVNVIPFGIDVNFFRPFETESIFSENSFVIGTVKSLEKIYGIDTLLRSFKMLKEKFPDKELKLLIIGEGTEKENLIKLSISLGIDTDTVFTGKMIHSKLPLYYNMMDVALFLSRKESFGVSVLESLSCEIPVIVSNVGGLPEIVDNNVNGIIVKEDDPQDASEAMESLLINEPFRKSLGKKGREKVINQYNFENNLEGMMDVYKAINKKFLTIS